LISPVFSGVRVAQYFAYCVVFCRSLFVLFLLIITLTTSDYPLEFLSFSSRVNSLNQQCSSRNFVPTHYHVLK